MSSEEGVVLNLQKDGYTFILPWRAEPGEVDFEHAHSSATKQVILEGEITFYLDNREQVLRAGEIFSIPPKVVHSAVVGPAGCYYIFALK